MTRFACLLAAALLLCSPADARPPARDARPTHALRAPSTVSTGTVAGVFGTAQSSTTWFGGTTWDATDGSWEALPDSLWTFDTGVGSSFGPTVATGAGSAPVDADPFKAAGLHTLMEGWIGVDRTRITAPDSRRHDVTADWNGTDVCVGSPAGLGGTASFWTGSLSGEAAALCYAAGQGYGNGWTSGFEQTFAYGGGNVLLEFAYVSETEPGYDYNYVVVDTAAGEGVVVAAYTGALGPAAESILLTPGTSLPSSPGPVTVRFLTDTDEAYSDEDGLFPTACGALAVDDIQLSGGIAHSADFESGDDGWTPTAPLPGEGGEWSDLLALSDLPPIVAGCECDIADSVLVFIDPDTWSGPGHGLFQHNTALSPWIDLDEHGLAGSPVRILEYSGYFDLPLLNYVYTEFTAQWWDTCGGSPAPGPITPTGRVYYYGGAPSCGSGEAGRVRVDLGTVVPPGADRFRVGVGLTSYCRFFAGCSGLTNTTPWFDNVRVGVAGGPGAPVLSLDHDDAPLDAFPADGTLDPASSARVDSHHRADGADPGDTLVVRGGLPGPGASEGAEVRVQFTVRPGPLTDTARLASWLSTHAFEGTSRGLDWYSARMDTARHAYGEVAGAWMTAYHEQDPNFTGSDEDTDPGDPDSGGGFTRPANDIFPDDLLTMGARLSLFYKARYLDGGGAPTTGAWFTLPDTTGGTFLDVEVLPSSLAPDTTWNCVLYVNHGGEESREVLEPALGTVLPGTSANADGTAWDRFDLWPDTAPLARPLQGSSGATASQLGAYRTVFWESGIGEGPLPADATLLLRWLSADDGVTRNLYLSGDAATNYLGAGADAEELRESYLGVSLACGWLQRPYSCYGENYEACMEVDPAIGAPVGNAGNHALAGESCNDVHRFNVFEPHPSSAALGDEVYATAAHGDVGYLSVVHERTDGPRTRTVTEGATVTIRRDRADCAGPGPVADRLARVFAFFGHPDGSVCGGDAATVATPPGPTTPSATRLHGATPNPVRHRAAVRFDLDRPGPAEVLVLDVAGRRVRSLWNATLPAGSHTLDWDGRDDRGVRVPRGVYFLRLRGGSVEQSRKMVVVH